MDVNPDSLALLLNSVVTYSCGGTILYLLYRKKLRRHIFYYAWLIGFILYATQIAMRALSTNLFIVGIPVFCGYLLFNIALWSLSRRKDILYSLILLFLTMTIFAAFFFSGMVTYENVFVIASFIFYIPITASVVLHRAFFGRSANNLALGWFILFLANFILYKVGWVLDIVAIFAKFILLLGIMDYDFIILATRIREGLVPRSLSIDTGYGEEGGLNLVVFPPGSSYLMKVQWIERKIKENIKRGINNYVFSFQDVIPHKELRRIKWINPEKVFVFLFSASAEKSKKEFWILPMGITEIGATLSEVTKKYLKLEEGCAIFFINLSLLIHVFGANTCYNMLLNKMGSLREARVKLFAFFHPETHSDKPVIHLFENISDEVIRL